ncbi:MAG: KEOPS complex kinase/ATPase Bud32 [archaeon]
MKEIARGAEAVLYEDKGTIIKHRLKKEYRIKEIDEALRKFRTRREAKLLQKVPIPAPKLISTDDKETIVMSKINGKKVRDILDQNPSMAKEIGEKLAKLHDADIIHGDLTTSNMMLDKEIVFIDFGLSFHSNKIEDKAVDIHLFRQALESKHFKVKEQAYKEFLKGYQKAKYYKQIMERLKNVEMRGRYKHK